MVRIVDFFAAGGCFNFIALCLTLKICITFVNLDIYSDYISLNVTFSFKIFITID